MNKFAEPIKRMLEDFRITVFGAALTITLTAFATIAGAWVFEAFGYLPCELCLKQRYAYYIGAPLAALTAIAAARNERLARALLMLLALLWSCSCE